MSVSILKKGSKAADAQKYLSMVMNKTKRIMKEKEQNNIRDATVVEKFIRTRKEVMAIERDNREEATRWKALKVKQVEEDNLRKNNESLAKVSERRLVVDQLKKKIEEQMEKIEKNKIAIEKLNKPQRKMPNVLAIEKLKKQCEEAESRLYVLNHAESLAREPEKLKEFIESIPNYAEPSVIANTVEDAWNLGPSQVRDLLKENYKEIQEINQKIIKISEILNKPPEEDLELKNSIMKKLEAEQKNFNFVYEKKLNKSIEAIKVRYDGDIKKLKLDIETLKQRLSISHLKLHK